MTTGSGLCQTAWYYRWGLLPEKTLDLLINESSGEQAFNTISDLSLFNRKRKPQEFSDALYESEYITGKLKEYGLEDVSVERLGKTTIRVPVTGLLEEVSPGKEKIADVNDLPFVLGQGNTGDTEGDLVYIGDAFNGDLDNMDLKGKIALTSARAGGIMNTMLQKGASGIISYYSPRPLEDPLMIPDQKGGGSRGSQSGIFSFSLSPREGHSLRDRLLAGEKIKVHASVKFRTEEIDNQVPTCVIRGTDPAAGEIIFSAHLFEGYGSQGANDNVSGSAVILETARILNKLISDGKIPRPRRSIRFIWVAEYSGTIPWVNNHKDLVMKTLCNINLDMVGLSLSRYQSYFVLHRTTYGNAHYLNDVLENYYRYVSENNQENSVVSGSKFFKRIVAPTGSEDPFYFEIETSSGGSDHDVFNDWGVGVPGVLMITWPDPFYHTSDDRADKMDPTQLRRVAFITSAAAYTIAGAGENEAIAIEGEVYGNSVRRLGYQISMSNDLVNKANADNLISVLKRSLSRIKGTVAGEAMTLSSVQELSPSNKYLKDMEETMKKSLSDMAESAAGSLLRTAEHMAADFGMAAINVAQTKEEKSAAAIVPVLVDKRKGAGYNKLDEKLNGLAADVKSKYPFNGYIDTQEAASCINGKNSLLDIKYLLDAQGNNETALQNIVNLFRRLEAAGIVKL